MTVVSNNCIFHFSSAAAVALPSPEMKYLTVNSLTQALYSGVGSALPCQQPIAVLPAAALFSAVPLCTNTPSGGDYEINFQLIECN